MSGRRSPRRASLDESSNDLTARNNNSNNDNIDIPSLRPTSRVPRPYMESISKRGFDSKRRQSSSESLPPASGESIDTPTVTKPQAAKLPPISDVTACQQPFRFLHNYHSSGNSRAPSRRTSSSSLQALNEHTVVDARSDKCPPVVRASFPQRMSQRLASSSSNDTRVSRGGSMDPESVSQDYPVYPNQSYAVLQSQVHPTYQPPILRDRNSYPSRIDTRSWFSSRISRTAGNTPVSSPGLFSVKNPPSTPPLGSDDETRISSPYLHPTHLQPPKEYDEILRVPALTSMN